METKGPDEDAIAALTYLGALTDHIRRLETMRVQEIEVAREHGASWRFIGVALGTTTQAAWTRYSGHQRDSEIPNQGDLFSTDEDSNDFEKHQPGMGKHATVKEYESCPWCSIRDGK